MREQWIFDGHIAGIGTSSGLRVVAGIWQHSPFGSFSDVMVQQPSGHRILLAPTEAVAAFISATYSFDEVQLAEVHAKLDGRSLTVDAGPLSVDAVAGRRTLLGAGLKMLPRRLAVHPRWLKGVSPLAAVAAPGARTFGTAGQGRLEFYGVSDLHHMASARVTWGGLDAGLMAPVLPPVTFGFSSVPPRPSIARVRTTVLESDVGR